MKKVYPKFAWIYILVGIVFISLLFYIIIPFFPEKDLRLEENPEDSYQKSEEKDITELKQVACEAADEGGTCQTKLLEIGLVTPSECCESFGKCCEVI